MDVTAALPIIVTPAQAGVQGGGFVVALDARFRGHDEEGDAYRFDSFSIAAT
jgi:hypothetical protein